MDFLRSQLMERIKMTALINGFSILKLPLLAFLTPEFTEFSEDRVVVKIRLGYRSRNHLGSMYFGALAMGAELSIAAMAVNAIQKSGRRVDFIFKDFEASFLKRPDGHVLFSCEEAAKVRELIERTAESSERLEGIFQGAARVENQDEPVMTYRLTLSVKSRSTSR